MMFKKIVVVFIAAVITFPIYAKDTLQFSDAWVPEAPPVVKVMAGYLKIKNMTAKAIDISKVTSPDFEKVEMHLTVEKDGMSRMLQQDVISVAANDELLFQRGGLHLMLINAKHGMKRGDKITLNFSTKENTFTIMAEIKEAVIEDHSHHHHH